MDTERFTFGYDVRVDGVWVEKSSMNLGYDYARFLAMKEWENGHESRIIVWDENIEHTGVEVAHFG